MEGDKQFTPAQTSDSDNTENTERDNLDSKILNMKKCDEALKEECPQEYGKAEEEDDDNEEFAEAIDLSDEYAEFDEEHLKQIYDNMSDEQLEEFKLQSTSLKNEGNEAYRKGDFHEALSLYTRAINSCPLKFTNERSILFANRAAAYVSMERKKEALEDCNKALELNPDYFKVWLRRAQLNRKLDNLDQSLEDYKKVLEMDRENREAMQASVTLPGEITERNEKLKTEMLGKLKDLGNMVLKPFGLSTNNFNVVQDAKSGGYSINFQNNK